MEKQGGRTSSAEYGSTPGRCLNLPSIWMANFLLRPAKYDSSLKTGSEPSGATLWGEERRVSEDGMERCCAPSPGRADERTNPVKSLTRTSTLPTNLSLLRAKSIPSQDVFVSPRAGGKEEREEVKGGAGGADVSISVGLVGSFTAATSSENRSPPISTSSFLTILSAFCRCG